MRHRHWTLTELLLTCALVLTLTMLWTTPASAGPPTAPDNQVILTLTTAGPPTMIASTTDTITTRGNIDTTTKARAAETVNCVSGRTNGTHLVDGELTLTAGTAGTTTDNTMTPYIDTRRLMATETATLANTDNMMTIDTRRLKTAGEITLTTNTANNDIGNEGRDITYCAATNNTATTTETTAANQRGDLLKLPPGTALTALQTTRNMTFMVTGIGEDVTATNLRV